VVYFRGDTRLAVHRPNSTPLHNEEIAMTYDRSWLTSLALGAAGGIAGTLAVQTLMTANQQWLPSAAPPIRQDPGEFMVQKAEEALPASVRRHIPEVAESGMAKVLALGYGVTFGALYGACRPAGGSPFRDGLVLGMVTWAAGYLGWLPALGLMPPVWKHQPRQVAAEIVEHIAYGAVTVAAYDWLQDSMDGRAGTRGETAQRHVRLHTA
jgi:hypothetical protein